MNAMKPLLLVVGIAAVMTCITLCWYAVVHIWLIARHHKNFMLMCREILGATKSPPTNNVVPISRARRGTAHNPNDGTSSSSGSDKASS